MTIENLQNEIYTPEDLLYLTFDPGEIASSLINGIMDDPLLDRTSVEYWLIKLIGSSIKGADWDEYCDLEDPEFILAIHKLMENPTLKTSLENYLYAHQDSDDFDDYVTDIHYDVEALLNKKYPGVTEWRAVQQKFGWRQQVGQKEFSSTDGKTFLNSILPRCDYTFRLYDKPNCIGIICFHHDNPTGYWTYVEPK